MEAGGQSWSEYNGAGVLQRRYVYGPGLQVVAMVDASWNWTYLHQDKRNSTIATSNPAGAVTQVYTYDPYGQTTVSTGVPFLYTGHRLDAETGLYYTPARYYDPMTGSWLVQDPIGTKDGLNEYAYVGNDPVNKMDPKGTDAVWVVDQNTGQTTLVIPVQFSGQDASAANVGAIVNRDNTLSISNPNMKIQVISTSTPINGVLNKMDFSPGYNNQMCGGAGECVNKLGGDTAHFNSANNQSTDAAAHDVLHFAGIKDQYQEGPRDPQGNRTSTPTPGYNNKNIMTSRSGTQLTPQQFGEARGNPTTKQCAVQTGSRITVCQ